MELPYNDNCIIKGEETVDSKGKRSYITIYNGKCDFQSSKSNVINGVTMAQNAKVYLPLVDIQLSINLRITITTSYNKIINANILDYQEVILDKIKGIEILLDQTNYS